VQDQEIKFGYAITGEVDPARMWTNAGAKPGDGLLLTKPLGTGVIATAIKFGRAGSATADRAIASMIQLNKAAADALGTLPPAAVHACTDVTGFGLIGHATEMARASHCAVVIETSRVPLLEGARELVEGNTPGGGRTNKVHFSEAVDADPSLEAAVVQLMYDPQTSGGLLVAVEPGSMAAAIAALRGAGVPAHEVGVVVPENPAPAGRMVAVVLR
jgi:selenide,water dikinase